MNLIKFTRLLLSILVFISVYSSYYGYIQRIKYFNFEYNSHILYISIIVTLLSHIGIYYSIFPFIPQMTKHYITVLCLFISFFTFSYIIYIDKTSDSTESYSDTSTEPDMFRNFVISVLVLTWIIMSIHISDNNLGKGMSIIASLFMFSVFYMILPYIRNSSNTEYMQYVYVLLLWIVAGYFIAS